MNGLSIKTRFAGKALLCERIEPREELFLLNIAEIPGFMHQSFHADFNILSKLLHRALSFGIRSGAVTQPRSIHRP
ncbi:hypothetical protein [Synechococcus sp. CBW1006]|uniref:hypothetical protein n=1 Tax=Synechococcus sp. CBW1006 TaxID=1353138 RepID=UPI0018CF2779|nr:hypothetical protein [Synechococcus sp. CBW1006]QPN65698.1 hypothetical protein H8F26_12355 [Synechococcus sp. CBW1006]